MEQGSNTFAGHEPPPPVSEKSAAADLRVDIAARSHPEKLSPNSRNHHLVLRIERILEALSTNLPENTLPRRFHTTAYGMLIAAGLGGNSAGELASAIALRKLIELVVNTPDWILKINRREAVVVQERMRERFRQVDAVLKQHTEEDPALSGMSTTLTVACSLADDLFISHIGDSRAYLLRADKLHQLTRDHTLAQALIDAGISQPHSALVRSMRRVLTAALGTSELPTEPEIQHLRLCHGDQLLLCTSGLTDWIDGETISSVLRSAGSADEACRLLLMMNAVGGGDDKVTVLLARYHGPQIPDDTHTTASGGPNKDAP